MPKSSSPSDGSSRASLRVQHHELARAVVGNEFASIEIVILHTDRGVRAVLRDVASGQERELDPLILEALVHMSDEEMARLAHPDLIVPGNT